MILRNQISAAAGIPQKRSSAFFHQAIAIHRLYRDSVSVGFRTADGAQAVSTNDRFLRYIPDACVGLLPMYDMTYRFRLG
jgi:hypothetical protein